jgi:DNA-binding MarR family transcriptional regulator
MYDYDNVEGVKSPPRESGRQAWQLLSQLSPVMRAHWSNLAAEFDLSPAQGMALRWLEPGKPVPMNSLAEVLLCDASNVTGIVDKLEARGFIARQAAPEDRRVKMLVLTTKGQELRRKFIDRTSAPPASIAALPADDQRKLCSILQFLIDYVPGTG